jgi:outer membrane protein assembly factor BamE (lipoprotein component of BamABCDE complex)
MVILNGCCWNGPNFGAYVNDRTVEHTNTLTSVASKIDPSTKAIKVGMTKMQVLEAWGKPDWYGPGEEKDWYYSNRDKSDEKHPVTYHLYFENEKVVSVGETIWGEKKWECRTIDL